MPQFQLQNPSIWYFQQPDSSPVEGKPNVSQLWSFGAVISFVSQSDIIYLKFEEPNYNCLDYPII